jgi:hypothetical protein
VARSAMEKTMAAAANPIAANPAEAGAI